MDAGCWRTFALASASWVSAMRSACVDVSRRCDDHDLRDDDSSRFFWPSPRAIGTDFRLSTSKWITLGFVPMPQRFLSRLKFVAATTVLRALSRGERFPNDPD